MANRPTIPKDVVDRQMASIDALKIGEKLAKAVKLLPRWAENERAQDLADQFEEMFRRAQP